MTKEEILKQIEELKKQIEALPDKPEEKIRTLPIDGEKYRFISTIDLCSYERNCPVSFDAYQTKENSSIGNYFKSEEDAQKVIKAMRIEQSIRVKRIELNNGWEPGVDDETKYYICAYVCPSSNKYLYISETDDSLNIFPIFGYYKTYDDADKIIEEFKDDLVWYFDEYYPNRDKMYIWSEREIKV